MINLESKIQLAQVFYDPRPDSNHIKTHQGNLAGVLLLSQRESTPTLQAIASKHNLPALAFVIPLQNQQYSIRWFAPKNEIQLCGHASLAAALILAKFHKQNHYTCEFIMQNQQVLSLSTNEEQVSIRMAPINTKHCKIDTGLAKSLNCIIQSQAQTPQQDGYNIIELDNEMLVNDLSPDFTYLRQYDQRALIVTAIKEDKANQQYGHIVFRYFAPQYGNEEDQATGSALCVLADYYWANYHKTQLTAQQLSTQGALMQSHIEEQIVTITGAVKLIDTV